MLLTNNYPDLYALTLCNMFRKTNLFQHSFQKYQRIRMKNIDVITLRLLVIFSEISGKFTTLIVTVLTLSRLRIRMGS